MAPASLRGQWGIGCAPLAAAAAKARQHRCAAPWCRRRRTSPPSADQGLPAFSLRMPLIDSRMRLMFSGICSKPSKVPGPVSQLDDSTP